MDAESVNIFRPAACQLPLMFNPPLCFSLWTVQGLALKDAWYRGFQPSCKYFPHCTIYTELHFFPERRTRFKIYLLVLV